MREGVGESDVYEAVDSEVWGTDSFNRGVYVQNTSSVNTDTPDFVV